MKQYGEWAFIGGLILAVLAAFFSAVIPAETALTGLVVLGLAVGFLNIAEKESLKFLVSAAVLLLAGAAGLENLPVVGTFLGPAMGNIGAFVASAAIVVALKGVYDLAGKAK